MTDRNWDKTSRVNHWVMAFAILLMLSFGLWLEYFLAPGPDKGWFVANHKADGVIILIFALWRVGYRLVKGFKEDAAPMAKWQSLTSRVVHWFLLLAVLAVPVAGMAASYVGGRAISIFGLFSLPASDVPNKALAERLMDLHGTLAWALMIVLVLHVLGALKHHYFEKDDTLKRMLGRA